MGGAMTKKQMLVKIMISSPCGCQHFGKDSSNSVKGMSPCTGCGSDWLPSVRAKLNILLWVVHDCLSVRPVEMQKQVSIGLWFTTMCLQHVLLTPPPNWNQYLLKLHPGSLMFQVKLTGIRARTDCADVYREGFHTSGVYQIYPSGPSIPLNVYCDMESDGGGWTVFQRRINGSVDFYRGWDDYKRGFGSADGEYWLGLQNIHALATRRKYELRIDLEDFENKTVYAKYEHFALSPSAINAEEDGYRLQVLGFIDGGAGDSLAYHNGLMFSTFDRNHRAPLNCAQKCCGAFWYKSCHTANLNGLYLKGPHSFYANGIHWATWTGYYYSLRATAMKMRPNSLPFPG